MEGLVLQCRDCEKVFGVCRRCWRGGCYCSEECKVSRQKKSHLKSQKKYLNTPKGRECQRANQKIYRDREKTSVIDEPSKVKSPEVNYPLNSEQCRFCGRQLGPRYWPVISHGYFSFKRWKDFKNAECRSTS